LTGREQKVKTGSHTEKKVIYKIRFGKYKPLGETNFKRTPAGGWFSATRTRKGQGKGGKDEDRQKGK